MATQIAIDIVAVASGVGMFKTLCAAVTAGGLVTTLQSPEPFTVFAPTDDGQFSSMFHGRLPTY